MFLNSTIDLYLGEFEFIYRFNSIKLELKNIGQEVTLRNGVEFRKMNLRILFSEFFNFVQILKNQFLFEKENFISHPIAFIVSDDPYLFLSFNWTLKFYIIS